MTTGNLEYPVSPTRALLTGSEREQWLALPDERFGIPPRTFDNYMLLRPSHKYLSLAPTDHHPGPKPPPESTGMVFLRTNLKYPKLTTGAAMTFGHHATRNHVSIRRPDAYAFLGRKPIRITAAEATHCTGKGYVIVQHPPFILGMGLFYPDEDGGIVESLYPKAWASP